MKQLWPFICSSHWNPSKGKLSPFSPLSTIQSSALQRACQGQPIGLNSRNKNCLLFISGHCNEILLRSQCFYLGTTAKANKIGRKYEPMFVRQTDSGHIPSGTKLNTWSQCEDKSLSVYSIVLHSEYKRVFFTEKDWVLKQVFSIVS